MADAADKAAELQAAEIASSVKAASETTRLARTGKCHNCEDPVGPEQIYCDNECADDHAYMLDRLRANGRRS